MVTLIHLKDSLCPGSSHILAQYVKTKQGYIYALQVSINILLYHGTWDNISLSERDYRK